MPLKSLPLERGGPERLEIEWQGNYKDFEVRLDGVLVGSFENAKELKAGRTFPLDDGSTLEVKLAGGGFVPELHLLRNGAHLPGSAAHPEERVKAAAGMVFVVAALNAGLGLVAALFDVTFLKSLGIGLGSVVVGAVYGLLAYLVKEKRSPVALGLAVGLFVADGLSLLFFMEPGRTPPVGALVARVFFLVPMVLGFPALRALAADENSARPAPRPKPPSRPPARAASPSTGTASAAAGSASASPAAAAPTAGSASSPSPAPASRPAGSAATAPAARIFTGDAERRRLALSQGPATATSRVAATGQRVEVRTKTDADAASSGLRFVARKCEVRPDGLGVSQTDGTSRTVPYASVAAVVVRLLPPDPPWSSQPLLDAVVPSPDGGSWQAVRVFSTTLVNNAALPGGASTSRLETLRRLLAHIVAQNPQTSLDPETAAFLNEGKPPARFVNTTHFAEYDQRYS